MAARGKVLLVLWLDDEWHELITHEAYPREYVVPVMPWRVPMQIYDNQPEEVVAHDELRYKLRIIDRKRRRALYTPDGLVQAAGGVH